MNAAVSKADVSLVEGITYGEFERQKLDLYLPESADQRANSSSRPVIVFFYGGSWRDGDRADFRFVGYGLAQRGYAVVIADYRLVPSVRFPAFVEDAAQAISWTQSEPAKRWLGNGPIFVAGHSAGAHIAAMVTLNPSYLAQEGVDAEQLLAGWIGLSGPYDFLPFSSDQVAEVFEDVEPSLSQPIHFAERNAPHVPALLVTGLSDTVVKPKNSENLARVINSRGGTADLITYEGVGHVGTVVALTPLFSGRAPVLDAFDAFVIEQTQAGQSDRP